MSNYTIPKGAIYFNSGIGERYLGNTPGADLSINVTNLDHYSADAGIRQKDDTALVEVVRKLSITADDISVENWAMFIIGANSTQSQSAGAVTAETLNSLQNGQVKQGYYYQLGELAANPSGVREVSAVVVKVASVAKTIGTDYTVDLVMGRIYIVPGGGIADGAVVTADYTQSARTRPQVISASQASLAGSARFIAANPKGINRDIFMPLANLTPTGNAKLKGDQAAYMTLGFDIDILIKDSITAAIYIDGRAA